MEISPATVEHDGKRYELHAAVIEHTHLGYEDHGIFTFIISLDYGGSNQGAGLIALDQYDKAKEARVGTAFGMDSIIQVMKVVDVEVWEKLPGKHVYAIREPNYGAVRGLANIRQPARYYTIFGSTES